MYVVAHKLLNLFYGAVVLARLFPYGEKLSWRTRRLARYRRNVPVCLLAEALNALPERKRDIILLSYFLDMSDAEIGELLNVVRTTVFRHRKSALAKIKQYLEGKADDEHR